MEIINTSSTRAGTSLIERRAVEAGTAKPSNVLRLGIVAEFVNFLVLVVLNFAGPALLDTARFGFYIREVGVAFLALGLVDSPLALSLLVRHTGDQIKAAALRKSAISVGVAVPLGLITLGLGPALLASLCLCVAHSFGSSSISLAYRNNRPELAIVWYLSMVIVLVSTIYAGARFDWGAPLIVFIQSAVLFTVAIALVSYAVVLTKTKPFHERTVSTPALGIAAHIGGPLQWILVLTVGAVFGSIAAANVKVGTSLMNLPLASVPLSGQLLLAHAQQFAEITARAVHKRIALVAVLSSAVSGAVFLMKDVIFEILDLNGGQSIERLLAFVLVGGIGLAIFSTIWPTIAAGLLSPLQTRRLLATFGLGSAFVLAFAFASPISGLIALIALYVAAGAVAFAISLLAGRHALAAAGSEA